MEYKIKSFIGNRTEQQDSADAVENEKGFLAVLCDGMGGRNHGSEVSQFAVKGFVDMFKKTAFIKYPVFALKSAEALDRSIYNDIGKFCGSTLVSAYVDKNNNLYWLSIGDSRLYIFRRNKLRQITKDHIYIHSLQEKLENNLITQKEFDNMSWEGDALTSFLGMNGLDIVDINLEPLELISGDILLLSSDGLYKTLDEEIINGILSSGESVSDIADALIDFVIEKNEHDADNTTVIVAKI